MSVKLTKYTIDRRDLLKLTTLGAGGLYLANLNAFAADTVCQTLNTGKLNTDPMAYAQEGVVDPGDESASLFFMIDGTYTNFYLQEPGPAIGLTTKALDGTERTLASITQEQRNSLRILTKARVSIHCEFDQNDTTYIESVMLSDASHRILAMKRFTSNDYILSGNVRKTPYIVFDRLNLVENEPLYITYVRRILTKATIYQYKIEGTSAGPSRLDFSHLPMLARRLLSSDFLSDILGGGADLGDIGNKGSHSYLLAGDPKVDANNKVTSESVPVYPFNGGGGYVATAYYNQRPVPQHSVRARPVSIKSDGSFKFEIEKMHGCISAGHYMRYFLVLDPVGRILGGLRRDYDEAKKASASYTVESGSVQRTGPVTPTKTLDFKVSNYSITQMPHVQIITEDVLDAIARISYRIR